MAVGAIQPGLARSPRLRNALGLLSSEDPRALVAQGPNALPTGVYAWISSDPTDASDSPEASALVRNITMGVGQPVEYTRMDQNAVNVLNDTCAEYSFRLEVRAAAGPLAPADAVRPASTDAGLDGASGEGDVPQSDAAADHD